MKKVRVSAWGGAIGVRGEPRSGLGTCRCLAESLNGRHTCCGAGVRVNQPWSTRPVANSTGRGVTKIRSLPGAAFRACRPYWRGTAIPWLVTGEGQRTLLPEKRLQRSSRATGKGRTETLLSLIRVRTTPWVASTASRQARQSSVICPYRDPLMNAPATQWSFRAKSRNLSRSYTIPTFPNSPPPIIPTKIGDLRVDHVSSLRGPGWGQRVKE